MARVPEETLALRMCSNTALPGMADGAEGGHWALDRALVNQQSGGLIGTNVKVGLLANLSWRMAKVSELPQELSRLSSCQFYQEAAISTEQNQISCPRK